MACLLLIILVSLKLSKGDDAVSDVFISMSAVAGSKVNIPCDISSAFDGDEVYLVLWYKDESTTPIYSVDARRVRLERARHAVIENLSARAYFSTTSQPSVLEMESLVVEDEGEYRCRVDFRKARTRHSTIYLQIIVPSSTPTIKDQNGETLQGIIGPYNEGDRLLLICECEGGKPVPTLWWWKGTILLDDTYEVLSGNRVRNELEITNLNRLDLMAMYICQASNNNISVPKTSSVTLEMNFKPLEVKIEGNRQPLSANKPIEIVCVTTGSRPPAILTWRIGRVKLKSERDRVTASGSVTLSTLLFTPSNEDDGQLLSCQAENLLISRSKFVDFWKLEVHFIPQLTLSLGSKLRVSFIQEKTDVYFECDIRANPWVREIGWKFNNRYLHSNAEAGIIVINQTLVLQKVDRKRKGKYSCTAANSEGVGESNVLDLKIQYPPVCKNGQKTEYGALLHSAVRVVCEVDAEPPNISFHWEFNNTLGKLTVIPIYNKGTQSVVSHVPRGDQDYGTLYCWGENRIGLQRHPCIYSVVPADVPGCVGNCSINIESEHSFILSCLEGEDGGLSQHFLMEVREASTNNLEMNVSSDKPNFIARGLNPGSVFIVTVYSVNAKGRSSAVILRVQTEPTPESQTQTDDVWSLVGSPLLVVFVGILGGFISLAIFLGFYVKSRSRQQLTKAVSQTTVSCSLHMAPPNHGHRCHFCACSLRENEKFPVLITGNQMVSQNENKEREDEMIFINSDCISWKKFKLSCSPNIKETRKAIDHVPSDDEDMGIATSSSSQYGSVSPETSTPEEIEAMRTNCIFRYSRNTHKCSNAFPIVYNRHSEL